MEYVAEDHTAQESHIESSSSSFSQSVSRSVGYRSPSHNTCAERNSHPNNNMWKKEFAPVSLRVHSRLISRNVVVFANNQQPASVEGVCDTWNVVVGFI